jgi:isoleucyl-tRNA synthetase
LDYKSTLSLPRTDFPMKAGLAQLEPRLLSRWRSEGMYARMLERTRGSARRFLLHDGPPYANGHVHLGTALNKILKDFIVKSRSMAGFHAPFVPGWDCHGMPIEHNVTRELGEAARALPKLEVRKRCRAYAEEWLETQREEFQRLGCLGDWDAPYVTMSFPYEAETLGALGDLVRAGLVYRGQRPIHWCATCRTALAEAELEYHEHASPSIFVKFAVRPDDPRLAALADEAGVPLAGAAVLIWTTTPWTIPANLAIALHPEHEYAWVRHGEHLCLMADFLRPVVCETLGWHAARVEGRKLPGARFEGLRCRHPMFERDSVVILADYVTLDAGTGCVHTAPGHGAEDFESGKRYGLPILSPVDEAGRFTAEVPGHQGKTVFESNGPIAAELERLGALLQRQEITHAYPFCWRCKTPLIFRATDQWFLGVDRGGIREKALEEIGRVRWIPAWGEQRIHNMVATRPDWCLSRQRAWGVPIPALYCTACGQASLSPEVIARVAERVREAGADAWFAEPLERFLPAGHACPECGAREFRKEEDILDVWFDSSVSQRAVLEHHPELGWPCDLYLEATDQHRGWFQVSLLTAVGTRGTAPYRQVLTHGLILDETAKKMSKSLGNVIAPQEVIQAHGADVLRLLFSSVDYTADICFTRGMLGPMTDAYRKIRNTIRFMLGVLGDYQPGRHALPEERLLAVDRWVRARMRQVAQRVNQAYLDYEFHAVYHQLLELCTVDLSAFYLDVTKDRLYADAPDSPARRSAQTAMHASLVELLGMLAPILSFTCEEAWGYLPREAGQPDSVLLSPLPEGAPRPGDAETLERFARLRRIRAELNKALEAARQAGRLKDGLDARLELEAPPEVRALLEGFGPELADLLKLADLRFLAEPPEGAIPSELVPGLTARAIPSPDPKCPRCWNRRPDPGPDGLCPRCAAVIAGLGPTGGAP